MNRRFDFIRNLNGRNSASCGDYSLSVDLSPDIISAAGGCQGFVHRRESAVRPPSEKAE